jgi:hypothetical protein
MCKSVRIRIAILVLMLAVSHVALISHVTAHFEPDLEQCELCVSQAQLLAGIPCSDHGLSLDSEFGVLPFLTPQCAIPARRTLVCHQRAPPALSP